MPMPNPQDHEQGEQEYGRDEDGGEDEVSFFLAQPPGLAVDHRIRADGPARTHLIDSLGSHFLYPIGEELLVVSCQLLVAEKLPRTRTSD